MWQKHEIRVKRLKLYRIRDKIPKMLIVYDKISNLCQNSNNVAESVIICSK